MNYNNNERYNDKHASLERDLIIFTDFKQKVHVPPETKKKRKFQHQHFGKCGIIVSLMLSEYEDGVQPSSYDHGQSPSKIPKRY